MRKQREGSQANDIVSAIEILLCYAHEDKVELKGLFAHLGALQRQGFFDILYHQEISAETAREVDKHLETAQVVLLIVSQYFLSSDHCLVVTEQAMKRHKEGNAIVIPICLRPVYHEKTPFAGLQGLPTTGLPIIQWDNRDIALFDVAEGIRKVIARFRLGLRSGLQLNP